MTTFFTNRIDQNIGTCCADCTGDPCECVQEPCVDKGSCPRPDNIVLNCDTRQALSSSFDIVCCTPPKPNTMQVEEYWQTNIVGRQYTGQELFDAVDNWSIGTESNLTSSKQLANYYRKYVWTWSEFKHPTEIVGGIVYEYKPCKSSYCVDYEYYKPSYDDDGNIISETEPRHDYIYYNCYERWYPTRLVRVQYTQGASPTAMGTDSWNAGDDGMVYAHIYRRSGGKLHDESWLQRPTDVFANDCECGDTWAVIPGTSSGGIKYNTSFFGSGGFTAKVVSIT
jgi:hypothetical protein